MKLYQAIQSRRFAWLWAGQTCSRLGDFTYQIALAWWVLRKTNSAAAMGTVMAFGFVPMVVFLLIGGAAVDRYDRIKAMLISDVSRAALALTLAILAAGDHLRLGEVYVASFLFGVADAFFAPAYAAVIPGLVPAEHLPSANSLTSLSQQFGRISGPPLGALILSLGGTAVAFAVNGGSFVVAALCLIPLLKLHGETSAEPKPLPEAAVESEITAALHDDAAAGVSGVGGIVRDVREGIGFVMGTPWLWRCIVVFTLGNLLLAGPYGVTLPFLVRDSFGGRVRTLGWLYAMFPIGYALAAVTMGGRSSVRRRGMTLSIGLAIGGGMIALFGVSHWLAILSAAAIVNGFALEAAGLAWSNLMQERIPSAMLGRVSSIDALGSYALLPIAYAATGWASDHYAPASVFLTCGAATAVLGVATLMQGTIRQID